MSERRALKFVKLTGEEIILEIVSAARLPKDSPSALRLEGKSKDTVSLSFNPEFIGEFKDIDRIEVIREDDEAN